MSKKRKKPDSLAIELQRIPVGRIKVAPFNPRVSLKPGDSAYRKIKYSIESFGLVDPIVWNKRSGFVIGGNQRLAILVSEFGVTEVDVSVVDLAPTAERALCIALNKVSGEWDEGALVDLLREVEAAGESRTTGFEPDELEALYARSQIKTEIKEIVVGKPPAMGWVLISIPLVRYPEIAAAIIELSTIDGVVVETALGDA